MMSDNIFDEGVGVDAIGAIAKMEPLHAVFRDSLMAGDAATANFEEPCKICNSDTIRRVT